MFEKIKSTFLGFLSEGGKHSMIRLAMFITMLTACFSIMIIIIATYKSIVLGKITGTEVALIITSLAGFAGVFVIGKIQQKKSETNIPEVQEISKV